MNGATKVGAYVLGLAVVFGGALGVGKAVGPVGDTAAGTSPGAGTSHGAGHDSANPAKTGGTGETAQAGRAVEVPGGLQVSAAGYTLMPRTDVVEPGESVDFRFSVIGPDGRPVTRFTPQHEKKLHFIVVRRDLTGFQHLHPEQKGDGVWSVPLTLPAAGEYRAFADFAPEGASGMTLGMDLSAPGDYRPEPLAAPVRTATVDGYTVALAGDLAPGRTSRLTLSVSKGGKPVTDLEPYLGAYGHLVALRDGDLAYLHVHPDGEPGDGRTAAGPGITFFTEVPSAGAYRLFLDFKHGGTVRTAEFTATAGGVAVPATESAPAEEENTPAGEESPSDGASEAPEGPETSHNSDDHSH
ncbi:hypothetical protein GCM10010156_60450 [Planobispora rosea]|uniref:Secreted protein n=1 Tax=Planobispora rosea TaxID=35762 RepID=A0A8J3WH09_PLARO|nr:hypothetical protein [Planobispora rosea]GGS94076.1 hypothetical protein GCM10010156_60450 [Planobispora rosea]GIH87361.1 hypothetical protein Pro02_57690 [Planobispora rosea]